VRWKIFMLCSLIGIGSCLAASANSLMDAGKKKLEAKDFDGAIAAYSQAISTEPKNAEAYQYRGLTKSMKGDWKGCLEDENAALKLKPKNTEALALRAFANVNLGDAKAANEDFKKLESLDPKDGSKAKPAVVQNLISKAKAKTANHDEAGAMKDLNMVLNLDPSSGVAYHERGVANLNLKHYKEAIADFDNAIKKDRWHNQFGESYELRAKAKRASGDVAGAEADEKLAQQMRSK
jgi:tetratricopeptide (TPR) repeat protein